MSLQDKLTADLKDAMKRGDKVAVNTIRMLRGQIRDAEIAKGGSLTDDEEISVLSNAAKKRKEAIEHYEKSDRTDLLTQEQRELAIISSYLPKPLSREEIEALVAKAIDEVGATSLKELGQVMSRVMPEVRGRADGRQVQEIVRSKLG